MIRGLLLLALSVAQDDSPAGLIELLSSNEIQARERATQRLVEMGLPAKSALEKAAQGSDPETASRARSILGEIALEEHRKEVLGPTGRITLADGDYSLDQI